ncbi:MAG: M20/M25/M40 family metallo-hydrolase [Ruminococcaceae bacterium]|nr:M20/M25/M40 family metallo-hydrolase [Oscillospiraceae bacterium]
MIREYVEKNRENVLETLRELCHIPAPSFGERRRAEYCKAWLESVGAKGVYIDSVNNCIFPMNCEGSNELTVIAAHIDTVFPDTEFYPEFHEDNEKIYCPGVGDDTASVAVMLYGIKYMLENGIVPPKGFLFVCNACEEGLGNLVGTRQIMKDFEGRIKQFVTLDEDIGYCVNAAVGSHRYKVEALTEGGHSFSAFGKKNAIAALSEIVTEIYKLEVPKKEGTTTTYNVGVISGGTSVNTIAQNAEMLCEYRSDDRECLAVMQSAFENIFAKANSDEVRLNVTLVGDRPCKGDVDVTTEERLVEIYRRAVAEVTGQEISLVCASTDANVPMSLGIVAVDMGVFRNNGSHTREEWLDKSSVPDGLNIFIRVIHSLIEE